MDNDIIVLLDDDTLDILLEDDNLDAHMNEEINIVDLAGVDHSKLKNLDYEHSGHTGFAPLNILNNITVDEDSETLMIKNMEVTDNE